MHWWFTIAEEIHTRDPSAVPAEWRYRQSPLGPQNDPHDIATAVARMADTRSLLLFGRALFRYAAKLKAAGEDY